MKRLVLVLGLLVVAVATLAFTFPQIVRWIVVTQVRAATNRHVSLDTATLSLREGRLTLRGLRVADRDGTTPFADVGEFDISLHRAALLRGHLWIRELAVRNSTVRVVRLSSDEFNLSDLVRQSGNKGTTGPMFDVTVDRFTVAGATLTLEDRALPGGRTWTSERIAIDARDISTRHANGTATASSVTDGAPVSVDVRRLRLYPIDLEATVTVEGVDLALARVYMPADAPAVLERGRVNTSVDVAVHARDGLRVDATARFQDVVFTRPGESQPVALVPAATLRLAGASVHDAGLRLGQLELTSSLTLFDPRVTPAARFELPGLRVSVANLTWPVSDPARIDMRTGVPGGGQLMVAGTLQAAPGPSDLRVRLANLNLAPWARYLPPSSRITGIAEADLRINEPIAAEVPARIRGSIAVKNLGVADAHQKLAGVQRIEASGLEVQWPKRIIVKRLLIDQPLAMVERDRAGRFPLLALLNGAAPSAAANSATLSPAAPGTPSSASGAATQENPQAPRASGADRPSAETSALPAIAVDVGEIVVQEGAVAWRDEAVAPPAQLDASRINATVKGVGWPLRGPLAVQVSLEPPRGGELRVAGQVGIDAPPTADVRVALKGAELAPYQAYLPTTALVSGRADLDVAVKLPGPSAGSTSVRGQAALSRLDVRDKERTVMRLERGTAAGLDVQWPERVSIGDLALHRPWILLERDERGALPLRVLVPAPNGTPSANGQSAGASANGRSTGQALAVAVQRLTVDEGGARLVDRSVAPSFAIDLTRLVAKIDGLSTAGAQPARIELTGRLVPDAAIALQGTVGPLGGPLRVDVNGELREFAIPRTNPYLLRQVAWKAREGRLMARIRGRLQGDALDARSDIRLRHLELERGGPDDQAQTRIGLPLGLLASLMKNNQGDITVSFPVSGRLNDPRFDFSEAIWKSARTVAINAITAPVSWIGRLQYTPDSRIEKVQIDPLQFRPGTASLTPEGDAQTMRLAGFLDQVPEVRLALTPVVTAGDLAQLSRRTLETAISRSARDGKLSPEEAAARLFAQRFPNRPRPETSEAVLAALVESEPLPTSEASGLAAKRMETVREKLKLAKVDSARLIENKAVERRDATEGSGVYVDLVEQEGPKPPNLLDRLRRLGAGITGERPGP
jgi:Domain of Unknown Function (DUF748)